jgi:hypothetical protein
VTLIICIIHVLFPFLLLSDSHSDVLLISHQRRCHCSGLDPSAYITTKFKKLTGKQLTPNRVWKSKNQPPGEPSNPDCASKTAFNIAGIYGSVDKVSRQLHIKTDKSQIVVRGCTHVFIVFWSCTQILLLLLLFTMLVQAQVCFKAAVEQIKSKWDKVYIGQYLSASARPALSTDLLKLYAFIVYGMLCLEHRPYTENGFP